MTKVVLHIVADHHRWYPTRPWRPQKYVASAFAATRCIQRAYSQAIQIGRISFNADNRRATIATETALCGFGGLKFFQ